MQRAVLAFVLAAVPAGLLAQDSGAVATVPGVGAIRYAGAAVGFQLAFDVIEPAGGAFDVGGVGDVMFTLGRYGALCYKPSAGVWFGGKQESYGRWVGTVWTVIDRDWLYTEVYINIADIAYYFPLPEHIIVRPYAGLGVPLTIDHWSYEDDLGFDDEDTEVNAGFNIMAGADFRFAQRVGAFFEMRGKLSHRWNVVKLAAGMKFRVGQARP